MPQTNVGVIKKRIKNGELESYWYDETDCGARVLAMKFSGSAYPELVRKPEYQCDLQSMLNAFGCQRVNSPPAGFENCNGYVGSVGGCKILKEMLCVTRGKCSFYKAKDEEKEE